MTPLRDLYREHDAIWAEMVADNERCRAEGIRPGHIDKRGSEIRARLRAVDARIRELDDHDFEQDLCTALGAQMRGDTDLAKSVYASLSNVTWEHTEGSRYLCSWRYAGAFVADTRDVGEDYLDFYCSGNEGHVDPRVEEAMAEHGWHAIEDRP